MSTETFNRESLAKWYAKQHLNTDPGITKVIYLPEGAQPREIRFLEINKLIKDASFDHQLVPIDFGADSGTESEHKLYVVDLTEDQWNKVRKGELALPTGWSLESKKEFIK